MENQQPQPSDHKGTDGFHRKMKPRHVIMLSLGGVIGTGLFINSGYILAHAGPVGTILSYAIGAIMVTLVMMSLGELACAMPVTGSFHVYASKFISPRAGFLVVVSYWLTWTVALGTSLTAIGISMQHWFPTVPVWIWCVVFGLLILSMNAFTTRFFAEGEFWFALIKVVAVQVFVVLGLLVIFGAMKFGDGQPAPYFTHLTENGVFPFGVLPVFISMVSVTFAYAGSELIGVAAGETSNPEKVIPKAIRTTVLRLAIFFGGTIFVLACILPISAYQGVSVSPFVIVFQKLGIPYASDIMNFVILTAIISTANSGLYAASRMAWSLGNQGLLPKAIAKLNKGGMPVNAIIFSMAGGVLSLLTGVLAPDTVFVALTAVSGMTTVVVWASICLSHYNFRRDWLARGKRLEDLVYKAPLFPIAPLLGIALCIVAFVGLGFDPKQRIAIIAGVPFLLICYFIYPILERRRSGPVKSGESLDFKGSAPKQD